MSVTDGRRSGRPWLRVEALGIAIALAIPSAATRADDFDRLDGEGLAAASSGPAREALTTEQLAALPAVLKGTRSPWLVVATDRGNLSAILVEAAFRRPVGAEGEPVPILVLSRFATYEPGREGARRAAGREILLFDGFRFDLDSGCVVPDGQGGDLRFVADDGGARLVPMPGSRLIAPQQSPLVTEAAGPRPSAGRAVVPADCAGRYRLFANGQWSGVLELAVNGRSIVGRYRSDESGALYPVVGEVPAGTTGLVRFEVAYPQSKHEFEGRLWGEGKGAMAGTVRLLGRDYGFFAVRDGARIAPEPVAAVDLDPAPAVEPIVVRFGPDGRALVDGEAVEPDALADRLRAIVAIGPDRAIEIRAATDCPASAIGRALDAARGAGVGRARLVVDASAG